MQANCMQMNIKFSIARLHWKKKTNFVNDVIDDILFFDHFEICSEVLLIFFLSRHLLKSKVTTV